MCVVSNVSDGYHRDWDKMWPNIPYTPADPNRPNQTAIPDLSGITRKEFDDLKKEVEELKLLLLAAKRFDEETGQPECQMEEKVVFIRELARMLGVDLEGVFGDAEES